MIKDVLISLQVEILKVRRSMIFWITIGAACFMALMLGLMMFLIKNPGLLPPGILKTKVNLAAISADWPAYIGLIEMASGAIGIILFGFTVSWIFGREYTDRTLKDIIALTVSRSSIVISKLIVVCLWCILLSVITYVLGLAVGLWINLPLWSFSLLPEFFQVYFVTTLLSLLLCPVIAFVASAGRSFLPAIGFLILCMGLANFFGNIGIGAYFPWTIPMLYTGTVGDTVSRLPLVSLIIISLTGIIGTLGTIFYWKYADQNR